MPKEQNFYPESTKNNVPQNLLLYFSLKTTARALLARTIKSKSVLWVPRSIKSQNHKVLWVGSGLAAHLIPILLPGRDTSHHTRLLSVPSTLALDMKNTKKH